MVSLYIYNNFNKKNLSLTVQIKQSLQENHRITTRAIPYERLLNKQISTTWISDYTHNIL